MKILCPWDVDIPTYDFELSKTISSSYFRVNFSVNNRYKHGIFPFNHFPSQRYLFNALSSDQNGDRIQNSWPWSVEIPTYHFGVYDTFPTISQEKQIDVICKSYILGNLTYKHTTLGTKKLLVFLLLSSYLGWTIAEGKVRAPFMIVNLDENFPIVSWVI